MKKFIAGVMVGAMIFGGTSIFADSIKNLVGTKVTGTYTLKQNGEKVADAVILKGSAYVPVRTMSEATNTPLQVKGKEIIMGVPERVYEGEDLVILNKIIQLDNDIVMYNKNIEYAETYELKPLKDRLAEQLSKPSEDPVYKQGIEILQGKISERESYINDLKTKITVAATESVVLREKLN